MPFSLTRTTLRLCAFALIAAPALAAAEPGDMMHMSVTSQVSMANAPVAIPPQTHSNDVCMSHKHDARDMARMSSSRPRECTYSNYKVSKNSASFHMSCAGDQPMEGDATFGATAAGSHGTMHMNMQNQGQPMTVDVTIDATRTGTCDYTPPPPPPKN
jgi:hypothetical protein